MTVLNCDVKNCYFNKSSKCCKDGIQIGGTDATIMDATYCEDFREKTNSMTNTVEHCNCGPETKMDVKCDAVHALIMIIVCVTQRKLQLMEMVQHTRARQNVVVLNVPAKLKKYFKKIISIMFYL